MTPPTRRDTGIVLWSHPERGVAVIWCADQQRLAYYAASSRDGGLGDGAVGGSAVALAAGDLVAFHSRLARGLRLADQLVLIERGWHPELASALRETPPPQEAPRKRTASRAHLWMVR